MDLSIIIVYYKTRDLTISCIESIFAHTSLINFEIIVVDNYCKDDTGDYVSRRFPGTLWIKMNYNAGFSRANNAGIRAASGRYILLLNSDTLFIDNVLDPIIRKMDQFQELSASGVQLLNGDGSLQTSGFSSYRGGYFFYSVVPYWNKIINLFLRKREYILYPVDPYTHIQRVDVLSGAFTLIRGSSIEKAGLMDEDFFMYGEDWEYCSRLRTAGKLGIFTDLNVIHYGGGSSSKEYATQEDTFNVWDRKGQQLFLSVLLWVRKEYGLIWYLILQLNYIVSFPVFLIGTLCKSVRQEYRSYTKMIRPFQFGYNILVHLKWMPQIIIKKKNFYKVN